MVTVIEQEAFSQRLSQLRISKGVSARDMSLSIGQSPSYINNIETGVSFPSMTVFFYICEYLEITPSDFFNINSQNPCKEKELINTARGLNSEQLDSVISLIKSFRK